jgi:hypothetical protein
MSFRLSGVDQERSIPGDLRKRRSVAADDWRAAGHSLDHWQTEALVTGWEPDYTCRCIQGVKDFILDEAK